MNFYIVAAIAFITSLIVLTVPTNTVVVQSGIPAPASSFLNTTQPSPNTGGFYITSVNVSANGLTPLLYETSSINANVLTVLTAFGDDNKYIRPMDMVAQPFTSEEVLQDSLNRITQESNVLALFVAMDFLNMSYNVTGEGVLISQINNDSFLAGRVLQGDVITSINDQITPTMTIMLEYLQTLQENDPLVIGVQREQELVVIPTRLFNRSLGMFGFTKNLSVQAPITIKMTDIKGPSSGLMLTLELISRFSDTDLTKGRRIAGTGTINENQRVLAIDGVDVKIESVQKAGFDYMIVPEKNNIDFSLYDIPILEVISVEDAYNQLTALP